MHSPATFKRRERVILVLLVTAVLVAVTYGVVTYQTPYGCDSNGVAQGTGIDREVLARPCIYIYFTGIVGGSIFLILIVPVSQKNPTTSATSEVLSNGNTPGQMSVQLEPGPFGPRFYGGAGRI